MAFGDDKAPIRAAEILVGRRLTGACGPVLPQDCRPADLEEALAIQAAVTDLLLARHGERVAGWKCGLPEPGRLVLAPIYAGAVHHAGDAPVWAEAGQVKVEPELAFVLGRDLPARAQPYTPDEVDAAVCRTHLALELIHNRYDAASAPAFPDRLADGLVNQGLWLGPEVDGATAREARQLTLRVPQTDGSVQTVTGAHPAGAPRAPLYWLAEFLRARGVGLRAGQVVITGSYAGAPWVPVGEPLTFGFDPLGRLTVRLVARPQGGTVPEAGALKA
ncbi:MAG TPA: fumarylacetoacetate hydrolase family protein [Aquabacterium sp.]|nr:fumarylacetoacetate hydrolase family protein [Aquabacterium sp.]